ncbi:MULTISPECIES: DnaJ domain-containing protein [Nostocales]|jgi:DnaJ-domain-containing protein 1|uniref:Uncharacterized protein n=1 Tax=Dolichospermum flos-aquae UHCC 0037 TaxID=2590026 RepID=A0ACC7SAL5_DOLFA|nr:MULTISPECIES: DnaJ domain-containing protein [Nostocales]MBO1063242.1 DnaJ domain-containing protein [Anabaena sp. 54]MTJ45568.1 hypothetical protein [Dolichospermum flos-aquae UHCC 0037]
MSKNSENYYDVLEISKNATAKEIREVYISLCKDLHPDKLPSKSGSHLKKLAEERLKLINEAYQILKDDKLRSEYDQNCTDELSSNARESVDNIEDLLSPSVLSEGFEILQQEEQIIWSKHMQAIDNIENQYYDYLSTVKGHTSRNLFPDTPLLKLDRFLRIIYFGLPFSCCIALFFSIMLLSWILLMNNFFPTSKMEFSFFLASFVFVTIGLLCGFIFSEDYFSLIPEQIEDHQHIYLAELHTHIVLKTSVGAYSKFNKLKSPIYKNSYVIAVSNVIKKLDLDILSVKNYRQEKINKFKSINPYQFTPQYISSLSLSERFLFVKVLKEKAKEEKGEEVMKNALKVAGAVGLVALWIGTGGGF